MTPRRLPRAPAALALALSLLWPSAALARRRTGHSHRRPPARAAAKDEGFRERPPRRGVARGAVVSYVIPGGAYLALGGSRGLAVGSTIKLERRGRPVADCVVAAVAPHSAYCTTSGRVEAGDSFAPPEKPAPEPAAEAKPLPPLVPPAILAQQRAAVETAGFQPVEFHGGASQRVGHLRAEVDVGESAFGNEAVPGSSWNMQSLDVALRGADLGGGFRAYADLTVVNYTQRPANFMFPEAATTQLFVRQLEVAFQLPSTPWTFSLGRLWPSMGASIGALDGAQAVWRNDSSTLEWGGLGGFVPDPLTTMPSLDHPLAGAYVGTTQAGGITWFRGTAYATVQDIAGVGLHYALDGQALLTVGKWFDLAAEVRGGVGALQAPDGVELATVDLDLRVGAFQATGGFRYIYDTLSGLVQPGMSVATNASIFGTGALSYDFGLLVARLDGSYIRDYLTFLDRVSAGPTVVLPHLFGPTGGVSAGYQEEGGWLEGRELWGQLTLQPWPIIELDFRPSYSYTVENALGPAPGENIVGVFVQAKLRATGWLAFQLTTYAEWTLAPQWDVLPSPLGLGGTLQATLRF